MSLDCNNSLRRPINSYHPANSANQIALPVGYRPSATTRKRFLSPHGRVLPKPGRGRSLRVNCRRRKLGNWPHATLQLDVGGRVFCVRQEILALHSTTRLGRIAYLLNRHASRQSGREVQSNGEQEGTGKSISLPEPVFSRPLCSGSVDEVGHRNQLDTTELKFIEESLENLKTEPALKSIDQLNPRTSNISIRSSYKMDSRSPDFSIYTGSNKEHCIEVGQKPSNPEIDQKKFAFVENMVSFAEKLSLEQENDDTEKDITHLCDDCDLEEGYFYFDRDPIAFTTIANYYRTNALHMPAGVCFRAFQEELLYWGINVVQIYSLLILYEYCILIRSKMVLDSLAEQFEGGRIHNALS